VKTGLGDYWRALNKDLSAAASAFLEHFDDSKVLDQSGRAPSSCAPIDQIVNPMLYRTNLVGAVMWLARNSAGSLNLVSHYPMVLDGARVSAVVVGDTPWEGQVEGYVHLRINGTDVTCFDPLFPLTGQDYVENESADFALAGFGVAIHPLSAQAERSNNNPQVAASLSAYYETGRGILLGLSSQSDAQELHLAIATVKDVRRSTIGGLQLFRATIELAPGVDIPLIFGLTSLGTTGWAPAPGESIAATFLLQGCLSSAIAGL